MFAAAFYRRPARGVIWEWLGFAVGAEDLVLPLVEDLDGDADPELSQQLLGEVDADGTWGAEE